MIRVRDLKVWFSLRRGLVREIVGRKTTWVRAVDGISFDVRRGEVHCLVGESGCGKTTTGKAVLGLVDATAGDVFLDIPAEDFRTLETATRSSDPASARTRDNLRRRYSLTWKETLPWSRRDILCLAGFLAAAFLIAVCVPVLVYRFSADGYANEGLFLLLSVVAAGLLGAVASLPPSRPIRRTPILAALLSIAAFNLWPIVNAAVYPPTVLGQTTSSPLDAWVAVMGANAFSVVLAYLLAPALAGGLSRAILTSRLQSEGLTGIKMRTLRRRLHLIFQDPYESLNPKQAVYEIVSEPLRSNKISSNPQEITALVKRSLEDAGLRPAEEFMLRFPHELSGGQRQRVSIAAALALRPEFIVADEPVSMLDVSIRTEILDLMMRLRKEKDLTYLFITHDLGLAWILADRVSVMYLGKIVESGTAEEVIGHPKHPYTQALISVVPSPDPRHVVKRVILRGERPDPVDIPTGCRFHPRCPAAFERCGWNGSEVAAELQATFVGANRPRATFRSDGPTRVVAMATPPATTSQLAEELQSFLTGHRDERPAFRAITDVRLEGGAVVLALHEWSEPELVELGPGNEVACHLVSSAMSTASPILASPPRGA